MLFRSGGSTSIPTSEPTHGSASSIEATSDPSSLPMPLTRTLRPLTDSGYSSGGAAQKTLRSSCFSAVSIESADATTSELSGCGSTVWICTT